MARRESSPPRLRTALVAVFVALALAAVAAPGTAGAAEKTPTTLDLSCVPTKLDTGDVTNCTATVKSAEPPAGEVFWLFSNSVGYIDVDDSRCDLEPVSQHASSCSMPVTGLAGAEEALIAWYKFPVAPADEALNLEFLTFSGGSLDVQCSPQPSVSGDRIECEVRVPSVPGETARPSGDVAFRAVTKFGSRRQQIEPECTLQPAPGGASCTVIYTPVFAEGAPVGGKSAVLAEYEGDVEHRAEDGTGFVEVSRRHEVRLNWSCDHLQPVLLTKFDCSATVHNVSLSGGAPTGELRLVNEGFSAGSFPNVSSCDLKPAVGVPKAATCAITYQPTRLGLQELEMVYPGNEAFEPASDGNLFINVREGRPTSTGLTCQIVTVGQFGKCIATVADAGPNPQAPQGIVAFRFSPLNLPIEFSPESCELKQLTASASRCEVAYRLLEPGGWTLQARYEGSASTHALSTGTTTVSAQDPVNAP